MRLPRRSLRWRVLLAMLVVFALGFCNLALYLYGTRDALRRGVLYIQAREIAQGFTTGADPATLPRTLAGGELSYSLYDADGKLLWMSDNLQRPRRLRQPRPEGEQPWLPWSTWSGRIINMPVRLNDGATLMVAKDDRTERDMIGALLAGRLRHTLIMMLPVGLCSALLVFLLVHWALRPVRHATEQVRKVGPRSPDQRLPDDDLPSEIRPLAVAVNAALDRLASAYAAERNFVADAAHELRTPLTVLDLRLQDARRSGQPDWPKLEAEMQQMRRLVSQLLGLARLESAAAGDGTPHSRTRLARVVREAVAALLPLFNAGKRRIEVEAEDNALCRGETHHLREVVDNLLHNALVHGAGTVRVVVRRDATHVGLDISDEGSGVAPAEQEAVFQRFRKGRQGGEGTGLGLAIVRRIVGNAGGEVYFLPDRRSTIRVRLPLATDAKPGHAQDSASSARPEQVLRMTSSANVYGYGASRMHAENSQ